MQVFHAYAGWLVSISWKRFFALAVLLIIPMAIIHDVPPFSWIYMEAVGDKGTQKPVKLTPKPPVAPGSASQKGLTDGAEEARREVLDAMESIREEAREAAEDRDQRVRIRRYGEPLMPFTMWFIMISIIIKVKYKGTVQAEAEAAQATEVAESESLKRQVIEARMAAMQAQVEPHFLFNTLASIDHLIETDPPRASKMQKSLTALLRATMPAMREAIAQATRDLGLELAVIRP